MHVLVTAASRHDATREIAEAIAAGLAQRGVNADAHPLANVRSLEPYEAVVVGSAVYMGRWLKPARKFLEDNAEVLARMPVWLFSSGPLGPPGQQIPEDDPTDLPHMLAITGAREHRVFAGRLEKSRLGLAERAAVRAVRAVEQDSRDWSEIDGFAAEIAAVLTADRSGGGGVQPV